ncbi:uncharacterized protein LOC134825479 isoform X2 [Bolinopsis microptera]|uniref:uncharacterized protein LOC134825479 isoform X2 n=1 Tax=Bolinopsis microptera TaxID=2820187 RepID=UPI00307ADDB5
MTQVVFHVLLFLPAFASGLGYPLRDYSDEKCPICYNPRVMNLPAECTRDEADETRTKACDEDEHCYVVKLGDDYDLINYYSHGNYHKGYNAVFLCADHNGRANLHRQGVSIREVAFTTAPPTGSTTPVPMTLADFKEWVTDMIETKPEMVSLTVIPSMADGPIIWKQTVTISCNWTPGIRMYGDIVVGETLESIWGDEQYGEIVDLEDPDQRIYFVSDDDIGEAILIIKDVTSADTRQFGCEVSRKGNSNNITLDIIEPPMAGVVNFVAVPESTTVDLTWDHVEGASSYNVGWRAVGAPDWNTVDVTTNSHQFVGLSVASNFVAKVDASNAAGIREGIEPAETSFTTKDNRWISPQLQQSYSLELSQTLELKTTMNQVEAPITVYFIFPEDETQFINFKCTDLNSSRWILMIKQCMTDSWDAAQPLNGVSSDQIKVWRITRTETSLLVECNGVTVLIFNFASDYKDGFSSCHSFWTRHSKAIKFNWSGGLYKNNGHLSMRTAVNKAGLGYPLRDYSDEKCPICYNLFGGNLPAECTRDQADETRTKACDEDEHCYVVKLGDDYNLNHRSNGNYHEGYNAVFFCADHNGIAYLRGKGVSIREVAFTTAPPTGSTTPMTTLAGTKELVTDTIETKPETEESEYELHPSDATHEGDQVLEKCIFEIEAAIRHPTQQYGYVFSRGIYVRLEADDMNMPVVSEGFPKYVDSILPELSGKIEAAFTDYDNARTFFFVNYDEKSTRQVYRWDWLYSEMKREDERTFAALPQNDIKGIASYRSSVAFLFANEYYEWTPKLGLNKEGRKYNKHDEPTNESGAFDAFLQGYHHNGRNNVPEKYVLLRSDVMHGGKILHTYSYLRFEEEMNLHVCVDHNDHNART